MKKIKSYMKEYNQRPEVKAREKKRKQSLKYKAQNKEYNQTPERKTIKRRYQQSKKGQITQKRYKQRNPEKVKARSYTRYHNLRGTAFCVCDSTEDLQGHHPNYDYPKWTMTLCREHHDGVKVIRRQLLEGIRDASLLKNSEVNLN